MRVLIVTFVLVGMVSVAPRALAQDEVAQPDTATEPATEDPSEERAAQFVGVRGPDAERIPGGTLLLSAYAVVWVLLFLFLLRMRRLQMQTAGELERLSAEIRATGGE